MTGPKTMSEGQPLYGIPIDERPPMPLSRWPLALGFGVVFTMGHITCHIIQLLLVFGVAWPIRILCALLGISFGKRFYEEVVRWTKGCYASLLCAYAQDLLYGYVWTYKLRMPAVLTTQWFSPTEITLSFEGDNIDLEKVLVRDTNGRLVGLNFPSKLVVMGNHQVRLSSSDYCCCLTVTLSS